MRQPGADRRLPRRVLAAARGQHLTHDDFRNQLGPDVASLEQRANDGGAELGSRRLRERAAELADRGAQRTRNHDVGHAYLRGVGCVGKGLPSPW